MENIKQESFLEDKDIQMDIENCQFADENWNPEDFSKEFAEFQIRESEELHCGLTYVGETNAFAKRYTSKTQKPMFSIDVMVNGNLATLDYVLDKENSKYLDYNFNKLKKDLKYLNYDLTKLGNLDDLVNVCNKQLLGRKIYIKPYEYNGFLKYKAVNPDTGF